MRGNEGIGSTRTTAAQPRPERNFKPEVKNGVGLLVKHPDPTPSTFELSLNDLNGDASTPHYENIKLRQSRSQVPAARPVDGATGVEWAFYTRGGCP